MNVKSFCQHAHPQIVKIPLFKAGKIEYHSRVILVPCGKCEWCRHKVRNYWTSRLHCESKRFMLKYPNGRMFFTTFTISNEWFDRHLSELTSELNNDMPLCVYNGTYDSLMNTNVAKHIYTKYWKARFLDAVRSKRSGNVDLDYYTCSEFGDRTERIHFHSILFVKDMKPIYRFLEEHNIPIKKPWWIKGKNLPANQTRLSDLDERAFETFIEYFWTDFDNKKKTRTPIGHTDVNKAGAKSFRYITKYVCKLKEDEAVNKCPFHRQSQGLGIDVDAICEAIEHNKPYTVITTTSKEYKYPISKYYRSKYSELLGKSEEMTESYLAQNRQILLDQMALSGKHFELPLLQTPEGGIDLFQYDYVRTCEVEYLPVRINYPSDKIWKSNQKSVPLYKFVPIILSESITLNHKPYDRKKSQLSPNVQF